jgi:hypothetical protein
VATTDYTLCVDWSGDGDFADTGELLTDRVMFLEFSRGKDFPNQLTGRSTAGILRAVINNTSNDYSPFNSSSALYGKLLPGRKVQVQVARAAVFPYEFPFTFPETPLWTGFIQSIEPRVEVNNVKTVTLRAIGGLAVLVKHRVQIARQEDKRIDEIIDTILDNAGWPEDDRALDEAKTTVTSYWNNSQDALRAIRELEESEPGFIKETRDGKIGFENREYRMTGAALISQLTFSDDSSRTYPIEQIEQHDPYAGIFNEFIGSVTLVSSGSLAVLWSSPEIGSDSTAIASGQTLIFFCQYPSMMEGISATALAGEVAVDTWTTPIAGTDYIVNTAADGSGSAIHASVAVAVDKFSNQMEIALTNNHASDGFITKLQARGTTIITSDPLIITERDATSQTNFYKRTYEMNPKWIPTSKLARDWATTRLSVYKDPLPRLTIGFTANRDRNTLHTAACGLEISDRITVDADGNAGLGIAEDFFVENIHHIISNGNTNHKVNVTLSPASVTGGFWALGTGKLGLSTKLWYT